MTCLLDKTVGLYRPRRPLESDFHRLIREHFDDFRLAYPECYARQFGYWRPVFDKAVRQFLKCGDLQHGFARVRCPDCRHEFLVAFSCKQRCICPSCSQKRTLLTGMHVAENVCLDVPHRQFVWTIPKRLRIFFRFHRALLARLPALAWRSLLEVYRSLLGSDAAPGGILAIQTFGQLIHFHPHIHGLITDGAFTPAGNFLPLPPNLGHESFLRLWENNVFRLLLDEDKIEPAVVDQIRSWRHSGFGIDRSVRLEAGDRQAIQRLAEYMARSPFSLARLIRITPAGQVIYRAEKDRPLAFPEPGSGDLFGGVPRNYQIFKPVDFLAELTQHIPNKGEHLIRYCGHYSNKARGLRARQAAARTTCPSHPADQHAGGLPPPPAQPATPATPDRRRWAMLIQHIYQVDPLKCPCCGGAMKILSFIEARQGDVIRKILQHCGLWQDPPSRSPPSPSAAAPAAPAGPDDDMRCTCQPDGDYLDFMRRQDVDEVEPVWEP